MSRGASGREEREGRECGNKGAKGRETEDESFAQPSITSLGLEFIWNNSSSLVVVWKTHNTQKSRGEEEEGESESRETGRWEEGLCLGVGGTEEELIPLEITRR